MPLRGMDFSRSNQAISRFNQFLQYDLLDQMRSDRDVAIMEISDKLQRGRQTQAGEIQAALNVQKHELSEKEAYTQAWIDLSKLPEYASDHAMAVLSTNPDLGPEFHEVARAGAKRWAERIVPLAQAHYRMSRGEAEQEDFENLNKYAGFKGSEEGMKETGVNIRAQLSADVDRERMAGETGKQGAAAADEATKRWINMLETSIRHLEGQGVTGTSMTGDVKIFMDNKTLNPLDPANQDKALTGLADLWQRVIDQGSGALTPGNKTFIQRVWNAGTWKSAASGGVGSPTAAAAGPPATAPAGRGGVDLETGSTPQEEQQVYDALRRTLIEQKTQEFINAVYGQGAATPALLAEARKHAMEYVDTQIMPSIRKK